MRKAGACIVSCGSRTFRRSWAIRALVNDSPIKTIAVALDIRYVDVTFSYAKAELKPLREVAMP